MAGCRRSPSNIAQHIHLEQGDVEAGFAKADVIVEREFTTPMFHQGYIEPHASTAFWNTDGQVTIWTTTQGAFPVRQQAATSSGSVGEGQGRPDARSAAASAARSLVYLEPVAALLRRKSGKPVKLQMDRDRGVRGHRARPRARAIQRQDRRDQRRQDRGGRGDARLRGRRLSRRSPVGAGAQCMFTPLRHSQRQGRRLRRAA